MANKASAKKENRKNVKRNKHNTSIRSRVATFLKKAEAAILQHSNPGDAYDAITKYVSVAMKAAKGNIVSKSAVSRKNSRLILSLRKRLASSASS